MDVKRDSQLVFGAGSHFENPVQVVDRAFFRRAARAHARHDWHSAPGERLDLAPQCIGIHPARSIDGNEAQLIGSYAKGGDDLRPRVVTSARTEDNTSGQLIAELRSKLPAVILIAKRRQRVGPERVFNYFTRC